ncbi:MAG: glycosyltransferase family 2 protein [Promethearchaeota archaeon]
MVLVSILIGSYNHGIYISEAIQSVLNQNFRDLELIVIDDCSPDNSREIIENYGKMDDRVKFFFHDINKGAIKTYNEAIERAKGKYIAFLNSDDVWEKTKLEKQVKILEKDENLIVWTEGRLIGHNSQSIQVKEFNNKFLTGLFTTAMGAIEKKKSGNIFKDIIENNFLLFSSLILKKENLGNIRLDDHYTLLADYQFEVDLARKYKFYYIKEPLTKYRMHPHNTFDNSYRIVKKDTIKFREKILRDYGFEISKKLRWFQYLNIIKNYFDLNQENKARNYIYKSILLFPFKIVSYWYLFRSFFKIKYFPKFLLIFDYILFIYLVRVKKLKPFVVMDKFLFIK